VAKRINRSIRLNITYDPTIPDYQWWVTWPRSTVNTYQEQYDFNRKVTVWAKDRERPIRGRSIFHIDRTKRYFGFQSEGDALTFIIVWSGDVI
jgi:hypothetical protein